MPIEFDATDYENVRKSVDISLTTGELPDAVIAYDIFKGEAVFQIESALSSLTEQQKTDNAADIKRAAILLTASFAAPKVQILTSETLEGDKFTFQSKDLSALATDLETKAFNIVGRILKSVSDTPTTTDTSFVSTLFTTAKACPK